MHLPWAGKPCRCHESRRARPGRRAPPCDRPSTRCRRASPACFFASFGRLPLCLRDRQCCVREGRSQKINRRVRATVAESHTCVNTNARHFLAPVDLRASLFCHHTLSTSLASQLLAPARSHSFSASRAPPPTRTHTPFNRPQALTFLPDMLSLFLAALALAPAVAQAGTPARYPCGTSSSGADQSVCDALTSTAGPIGKLACRSTSSVHSGLTRDASQ